MLGETFSFDLLCIFKYSWNGFLLSSWRLAVLYGRWAGDCSLESLELGAHLLSSDGWDLLDTSELWLEVTDGETLALESSLLHSVVVEGADGVEIFSLLERLELLNAVVHGEHLLHAVVVLAHVVAVLENSKSPVDLILEHF